MRRFADLYARLDRSTAATDKRRALADYFRDAPPEDAAWALWLLSGGKVGGAKARIAGNRELRAWVADVSATPEWLVDDCYEHVGDLAETLTLLTGAGSADAEDLPLSVWIETRLLPAANRPEEERRALIVDAWARLPEDQRLVFNKLLTGSLRVGVSQGFVQSVLAERSGLEVAVIAQRMMGAWTPSADFIASLLAPGEGNEDAALPYPFYLASPLEAGPESLGACAEWSFEWKWDGIRAQAIRRQDTVVLWSRGEERLDGRFPEIESALAALPRDAVLDGEVLVWREDSELPSPFAALQTRIQRRKPGAKTLSETPARLVCYDLLEYEGEDLRQRTLGERRALLEALLAERPCWHIAASPLLVVETWQDAAALRTDARARGVEGLMLKRLSSAYQHGRKRGDWWKWKIDPLTIDAVLLYAQAGHGRRSSLYTDYTFGVWDGERLVPVAKAYSGLDDAEILALDRWIRSNTLERFGPVRSVTPLHVFELGFEAVNRSSRHKSGVAVRFPRILRWRRDKPASEADRLDTLMAMAS
jgi:DNA ligase-1